MSEQYEIVCGTEDRDAWLEARRAGIGASDMAAVLGEHPYSSPMSVYVDKTRVANDNDEEQTEAAEWGLRLEPMLIAAFRERTGRPVMRSHKLLRSTAYPWALSTLDAWTSDGQATWPLQIKTTSGWLEHKWVDGPPEHYRIQQHHEMLVTGAKRHSIACLIGGQRLVWCDIERDEALIERIVRQGAEFWQLVQARALPAVDGSEATKRALRTLFPADNGAVVQLDASFLELTSEIVGFKERRKALNDTVKLVEEQIDTRENQIRVAIGDALFGVLPDNSVWTHRLQQRKGYTVAATEFRVLRYSEPKTLMRKTAGPRTAKASGE